MKRKYGKRKYRRGKKAYRRAKKKYKRRNRASLAVMPGTIVGDRTLTKLRYVEEISVSQDAGGVAKILFFHGNSLHDPNGQTGGTQPTGFDQWSYFYTKYKVYASKMRIQILSNGGTVASQNYYVLLVPTTIPVSVTPAVNFDELGMLPYAQCKTFNIAAPWASTLTSYMTTEKIMGGNKKMVEVDPTLYGNITGNPSRLWYWNFALKGIGGNFPNCTIRLHMTYYCEFFDRQVLDGS